MFLIKWGEINGRLDPSSNKNIEVFKSYVFKNIKLGKVVEINPKVVFDHINDKDSISFVPMESVDQEFGKIHDLREKKAFERSGFTKFRNGDLIWAKITPCMQNGKSAIVNNLVNDLGCGSTEFYVLRPKSDEIIIEYIHYILRDNRVLENAKNYFGGSAGQQRVSKDYLTILPIILPPKEIQKQIVDIMNNAYAKKAKKQQEAKDLLESINDYLLKELGIKMPEKEANTLENRKFIVSSENVIGGRFDPFYFKSIFIEDIKNILNSGFPTKKLANCIIGNLIKGKLPTDEEKYGEEKVIQISNINRDGTIDTKSNLTAKPIFFENQKLNHGDVLIVITGATIGKVGFWNYEGEYYLGGDLLKFDTGDYNLNLLYSCLMRTQPYQLLFNRYITGATNGHLSPNDVYKLPLPVVENETIIKLSSYILDSQARVLKLQREAVECVELAKKQVEKILLEGSL